MRKRYKAVLLIIGVLAVSCSSYFIADYNAVIDGGAVALQRKVDAFLTDLDRTAGTPAADYEHHTERYAELRGDLGILRDVAGRQRGNELTIDSMQLIEDNLGRLESIHAAGVSQQEIAVVRKLLDTQFRMLIQLENAKKRKEI